MTALAVSIPESQPLDRLLSLKDRCAVVTAAAESR